MYWISSGGTCDGTRKIDSLSLLKPSKRFPVPKSIVYRKLRLGVQMLHFYNIRKMGGETQKGSSEYFPSVGAAVSTWLDCCLMLYTATELEWVTGEWWVVTWFSFGVHCQWAGEWWVVSGDPFLQNWRTVSVSESDWYMVVIRFDPFLVGIRGSDKRWCKKRDR